MDAWLAYAPVKNNPEDAAKVRILYKYSVCLLFWRVFWKKKEKKRRKLLF